MENRSLIYQVFQSDEWMLMVAILLVAFVLGVIATWLIWGGKVKSLQDELKKQENLLNQKSNELKVLSEKMDIREGDLQKATLAAKDAQAIMQQLKLDFQKSQTALSVASDQVDELRKNEAANNKTIENLYAEIASLQSKNDSLLQKNKDTEESLLELAQKQSNLNAALQQVKSLKAQLEALQKEPIPDPTLSAPAPPKRKYTKKVQEQNPASEENAGPMPAIPSSESDDLKKIEGIGPKIEQLLNNDGIWTWKQLAETTPKKIREILEKGGPRYRAHDPKSWPRQARLAANGQWDKLEQLQEKLYRGKS